MAILTELLAQFITTSGTTFISQFCNGPKLNYDSRMSFLSSSLISIQTNVSLNLTQELLLSKAFSGTDSQ